MLLPLRRPVPAAVLLTLTLLAGVVGLVQRTPHGRVAGVLPIAEPVAIAAMPPSDDALPPRSAHADRSLRRQAVPAAGAAAHPSSVRATPPAARAWVRPSAGPVTSGFGPRWGRFHYGVDLGAPYGAPIHAATDGDVVYAGPAGGYGTLVVIRDWDGTFTAYGHMSSFARGVGPVRAGDVIAYVGAEGDAKGPHLHFEVRTDPRTPVDPAPFLAARAVAL